MKFNFMFFLIAIVVISSCSPTATVPERPTQISPVSTSEITVAGFEQKNIVFSAYLETTWGTGKDQWGDPIQFSSFLHQRVATLRRFATWPKVLSATQRRDSSLCSE